MKILKQRRDSEIQPPLVVPVSTHSSRRVDKSWQSYFVKTILIPEKSIFNKWSMELSYWHLKKKEISKWKRIELQPVLLYICQAENGSVHSDGKDGANSIFTHMVALDIHSVRAQIYIIIFLSYVETQRVQCQLEFRAHAHQGATLILSHTIPLKLDCQKLWLRVRLHRKQTTKEN